MKPRGIRNNNPLNVRQTHIKWQGQSLIQHDKNFVTFRTVEYGIRAAAKIIRNYGTLHGVYSLKDIIERWAPSSENDTDTYIEFVAQHANLMPDDVVLAENYPSVIAAMIMFENGQQPYTSDEIQTGVMMVYTV